jgi:PhzF family phenazine biosynthesis protein
MSIPIALVDAFTSKPFAGNPAAVCLLEQAMPDDWMQSVAMEMNQAETAFLIKEEDQYRLRWFTPAVEVDLCGHATLASAKYLYTEGLADPKLPIFFETRSGRLSATPVNKDGKDLISLDFPAIPTSPTQGSSLIRDALGADPVAVYRGKFDYLVELKSDEAVRALQPDLLQVRKFKARGIVVTARSAQPGYDYITRCFFPQSGIDEDPVTGSAHCMLAPFWAERLGKTKMTGYQASSRGGYVGVELVNDRVLLIGDAAIVLKGQLLTSACSLLITPRETTARRLGSKCIT